MPLRRNGRRGLGVAQSGLRRNGIFWRLTRPLDAGFLNKRHTGTPDDLIHEQTPLLFQSTRDSCVSI